MRTNRISSDKVLKWKCFVKTIFTQIQIDYVDILCVQLCIFSFTECHKYDLSIVLTKSFIRSFQMCFQFVPLTRYWSLCCYFSLLICSNDGAASFLLIKAHAHSYTLLIYVYYYVYNASMLKYVWNSKCQTFRQIMDMVMRTRVIDFIKSYSLQNHRFAFENKQTNQQKKAREKEKKTTSSRLWNNCCAFIYACAVGMYRIHLHPVRCTLYYFW